MTPKQVEQEAIKIVRFLVEQGLSDDQNYPYLVATGTAEAVTFSTANQLNVVLKGRPYEETYQSLKDGRVFCVLLPDGALLQMNYEFVNSVLTRHRLAYLPAPTLVRLDDDPELYADDAWFSDVISRAVVVVPIRFDFDSNPKVFRPVSHPRCHLTLGQFGGCRIPVSRPIGPWQFVDFVLRSFYSKAHGDLQAKIPRPRSFGTRVLDSAEESLVHVEVP